MQPIEEQTKTSLADCLVTLADLPELPPCCQRARERGYRCGYRDGYTYALWDIDKVKALGASLWGQIERFCVEELRHWVWRASPDDVPLTREGGPRLRFKARQPKAPKTGA